MTFKADVCLLCGHPNDRYCGCWRDRLYARVETDEWVLEYWVIA